MRFRDERGFIKYIVIFILLVVLISVFNIDVKKIIEHPFVQDVWHYIKIILVFIYDAFSKVFGQFQHTDVANVASSSTSVSK